MKNYFVRSIPTSHPVHREFANSIDAETILPAPKRLPFILIPLFNLIRLPFTFWKYDPTGNYLCEGFAGLYFAAVLKIFRPGINIVYHDADPLFIKDFENYSLIEKQFLEYFLNKINYVISDSDFSKNKLREFTEIKEENIKVVFPFVKPEKFDFEFDPQASDIIYVGRLSEEKNLMSLLTAFADVCRVGNGKLHIIGDGPLEQELKIYAEDLGIKERVNFLGRMENFRRYLKKSAVGYNVSQGEAFGLTGLEFSMSGVLPLIGERNGNKEVLKEDFIICDPDDVDEITGKMLESLNMDKKHKLKMLKKLDEKSRKFDKETQCNKFKEAFEELIK